jgi:hypothetical protein
MRFRIHELGRLWHEQVPSTNIRDLPVIILKQKGLSLAPKEYCCFLVKVFYHLIVSEKLR